MSLDPRTDKSELITLPISGRRVEVITPGGLSIANWRFTYTAYLRYEPLLKQAVDNWPNETEFLVPSTTTCNTFIARFRDARQAVQLYRDYNPVLHDRLLSIGREMALSVNPEGTKVTSRKALQRGVKKHTLGTISVQPTPNGTSLPDFSAPRTIPDQEELRAMVFLLSRKQMSGPITFKGRVPQDICDQLQTEYDIDFRWDEAGQVTVLI